MSRSEMISLRSLVPEITGIKVIDHRFDSSLKSVQRIHKLLRDFGHVKEAQIPLEYKDEFIFLLRNIYESFELTEDGKRVWKALNKTYKIETKGEEKKELNQNEAISPEDYMLFVRTFARAYKELFESGISLSLEQEQRCRVMIAMGEIEDIEEEIKKLFYSDMHSLYQLGNVLAQKKLLEVYKARLLTFQDWRNEIARMKAHEEKKLAAALEAEKKI